jgi:hypothetical protein
VRFGAQAALDTWRLLVEHAAARGNGDAPPLAQRPIFEAIVARYLRAITGPPPHAARGALPQVLRRPPNSSAPWRSALRVPAQPLALARRARNSPGTQTRR